MRANETSAVRLVGPRMQPNLSSALAERPGRWSPATLRYAATLAKSWRIDRPVSAWRLMLQEFEAANG